MDTLTPEQRLKNMRNIKGSNTKPEMMVRKFLYNKGIRYRVNYDQLPGKPDIYIPKYKTAVFVNGCFWHVHDCNLFVMPKTNREFWKKKLERNIARDEEVIEALSELGVKVIVVWECGLGSKVINETLEDLYDMIIEENDEEDKLRDFFLSDDWG